MNMFVATDSMHDRRLRATPRGTASATPLFVDRAKNSEIWTTDGRRYIDFGGGVGALNTGHLHPRVTAAVQAQLERFSHVCFAVAPYEGYVAVAERLNAIAPIAGAKKTIFLTTGVEAVENAVKIARVATGRPAAIAFTSAFHGRTLLGMALTGKVAPYKAGFGPFPADVFHAPFPSHGITAEQALAALDQMLKSTVEASRVAAIIVEPVQGEGGFNVAPTGWLVALRALCDLHGIVFIVDEVQAGFGRTGTWFAVEHSGVEPDLITTAKSLAGGFPLSAVTGKAVLMDAPEPGGLGGTYAGSPIGLAAAEAVMDVIVDEKLLARSKVLGERLVATLESLKCEVPQLADIRGRGSMIAAEFLVPGAGPLAYDGAFATRAQVEAMTRGLILLTCGGGASALRFLYPLTIEDAVFDEGLAIVTASIRAAAGA